MPRLGITLGDPCGIGPEVILKALADPVDASLVVYGRREIFDRDARTMELTLPDVEWREVAHETDVSNLGYGGSDPRAARLQLDAFNAAIEDAAAGTIDAIVTAPWTKSLLATIDHRCVGHTDILAERFDAPHHVMMLAGDRLRVALVTTHLPLNEVSNAVTPKRLEDVIRTTAAGLRRLYGIDDPHIAVAGLNPHAGEGGVMGHEEIEVIAPVVEALKTELRVEGPFAADTLFARFGKKYAQPYDAVVAMYHDQGLIPLKTLHFGRSANITLGLPIIRTSADHGSAYDIAGHGLADPGSMRYAIELARDFSARRSSEDPPSA